MTLVVTISLELRLGIWQLGGLCKCFVSGPFNAYLLTETLGPDNTGDGI